MKYAVGLKNQKHTFEMYVDTESESEARFIMSDYIQRHNMNVEIQYIKLFDYEV